MSLLLILVGAGDGEGGGGSGSGSSGQVTTGAAAPGAHKRKRGDELQRFLDVLAVADLRESAEPEPEPEPEPAQEAPRSRVVRVNLPVLKFERLAPRYQLPVMRSFADSIEDAMRDADRRRKLKTAMEAAIRQAQEDDDDEEALLLLM